MNGLPLVDQLSEAGEQLPPRDSFDLLSKPTLELSNTELLLIANDLRAKRRKFLQGVADKPASARKKAEPITAEAKEATTQHLLGELDSLKLDL
jgi:hypothetical protein